MSGHLYVQHDIDSFGSPSFGDCSIDRGPFIDCASEENRDEDTFSEGFPCSLLLAPLHPDNRSTSLAAL